MVDADAVLDDSRRRNSNLRRSEGSRLSEITQEHLGTTACVMARTTLFPFPPSDGKGSGVTLAVVEDLPPANGTLFAFRGHVLSQHLGRPLAIRQQREELSHAWTFRRGDLSLIPAGWRTTVWTEERADFLQVELCPDLVSRSAGGGRDVDLPCLFLFDDPLCRELSMSMLAEAQAHGAAARMYVESAAVVLSQRLASIKHRPLAPAHRHGLSSAVGMNVDHFSRMFKRSTGLAPHQYLGNIRLERAKRLLAEGRSPIIEIAFDIGYANPSQFSAFFRKR